MNPKITGLMAAMAIAATLAGTGGAAAYTKVVTSELAIQMASVTPLAMRYFCAQNRADCQAGGRGTVQMTQNLAATLKQVNIHFNRSIRPVSDSQDRWSVGATSGDCEDYVLAKRRALIQNGVSGGALRIAFTKTRGGEPHAVLVVRTSHGDYVLDNLNNSVKTLEASGYVIRSMSSANPGKWIAG